MSRTILMLTFVATLVATAGCAGPSEPASRRDEVHPLAPVNVDETTCAIAGLVLDDALEPLQGVRVEAQGGDKTHATLTDTEGSYGLGSLTPGEYRVRAVPKDHFEVERSVECTAGTIAGLDIYVSRKPSANESYIEVRGPIRGRIACAFGGAYLATQEQCGPVDSSAQSDLRTVAGPGRISAATYELQWTPSGAFGGRVLSLTYPGVSSKATNVTYETDDRHDANASMIWGESALAITIRTAGTVYSLHAGGGNMTVRVRAHGSEPGDEVSGDPSSLLVKDQTFDLYATWFYNGAAPATGYSGFTS